MSEYTIKLQIEPKNYEYSEEEIVYRIFLEKQLIIERSLPILTQNQKLIDCFHISKSFKTWPSLINFYLINTKSKKAKFTKLWINDTEINLLEKTFKSYFAFNIKLQIFIPSNK
jgi:hypothetical protein